METPSADKQFKVSPVVRVLAVLVLATSAFLVVASVVDEQWADGHAPFPYVYRDVALVHFLCAIPLAMSVASIATRRLPAVGTLTLAMLAIGIATLAILDSSRPTIASAISKQPFLAIIIRVGPALCIAAAGAMSIGVFVGAYRKAMFPLTAGLAISIALPWVHVAARSRHDASTLSEYVDAGRYGEAYVVAKGLVVLEPGREWQGRPIAIAADEIEATVRALEAQVAVELPHNATFGQRVNRARHLAMLGRTEEALEVLDSLPAKGAYPPVESLRGIIFEAREDWDRGLSAYGRALEGWRDRPQSPERDAEILRAVKGMAYCQRKMGRYAEAEASYLTMLESAPTADSHFLLAQFYEDTQQSAKAREHARKAMALAPDRYDAEGKRLINKLTVYHFGCLGVYNAEQEPRAPR